MLRRLLSPRPFEQTRQWNPPVNLPGCSCDFMSTYRGSCGLTTGPVVNYMFAKLMRSYGEDGDQQRKKLSTVGLNQNDQVSQKDQKGSTPVPQGLHLPLGNLSNLAHARFWERPSSLRRRNWPWSFGLRVHGSI